MKKTFLTFAVAALALTSCSKQETSESKPDSNVMLEEPAPGATASADGAAAATPAAAETDEQKGEKLLEGMDCLSCHKIDAKLVGPSYQDVAAKYTAADIDKLAEKIIKGGAGNWGEIPMTPHAGLTPENAKLMVKYILSLKK